MESRQAASVQDYNINLSMLAFFLSVIAASWLTVEVGVQMIHYINQRVY